MFSTARAQVVAEELTYAVPAVDEVSGLLQIAQAWIEDFYMVAVFLKRIQDNESPFKPVFASTFDEIKIHLGESLGQEAIEQMGKLWSIVVRGNQSIVEFNRNNPSLQIAEKGVIWNEDCLRKF